MAQSVKHFSLQAQSHEFKTQNLHENNCVCQRASQCWGDRDREIQISSASQMSLSGKLQASDRDCNKIPRAIVSETPKVDLRPPLMYTYTNTYTGGRESNTPLLSTVTCYSSHSPQQRGPSMHDVVTAHLDLISTLIPWGSPSPNSESDLGKKQSHIRPLPDSQSSHPPHPCAGSWCGTNCLGLSS